MLDYIQNSDIFKKFTCTVRVQGLVRYILCAIVQFAIKIINYTCIYKFVCSLRVSKLAN